MYAIFIGSIKQIYIGVLLLATHFCMSALIGCSGVAPTQPENTTPNPLSMQDAEPPVTQSEPFNITFTGYIGAYTGFAHAAAAKWEKIIVEGLPDVGGIDDVLIELRDGGASKNYIASASASLSHLRHGSGLPYYGTVTIYDPIDNYFDIEDIMDAPNSDITKILFHEIGHVLAFDYWALTYGERHADKVTLINGAQYFTGERAIDAYREVLYQQGEKLAYAIPDLLIPLESTAFHWRYPALKWDIMSPYFHTDNVLTAVTVCALEDLGYKVDMSQAEQPNPLRLAKRALGHSFFCDGTHIRTVSERE